MSCKKQSVVSVGLLDFLERLLGTFGSVLGVFLESLGCLFGPQGVSQESDFSALRGSQGPLKGYHFGDAFGMNWDLETTFHFDFG